jgi:hypothetical protein
MSKREVNLWSYPGFGIFIGLVVVCLITYIIEFCINGRYLEAILTATCGGVFFLFFALYFLGEILGSIRDLNDVLRGREKEDTEKPA